MKFSYTWLKELVPFKDSPKALADFLTMRAFEVETLEKKGSDMMLDIKLPANRVGDASGHLGMAREIAALKGIRITPSSRAQAEGKHISRIKENKKMRTADFLNVKIENPEDCIRYTARVMTDVRVGPSPKWLRERLEICGLQSINNIVDATNYVMLETGQPLHAFDWDRLAARKNGARIKSIVVRRAKQGERIETLDGKTYDLTTEIPLITDGEHPLAIAGIKGGEGSGISESTGTIVIESANFDSQRTRTASQLLRLKTDASYRFEHGIDPNQAVAALDRAAEIIARPDMAHGKIASEIVDAYPKKAPARKILFSVSDANRLLGTRLELSFYQKAFLRIGCAVMKKDRDALLVTPPTVRLDLAIPEDLIEEAGKILGYERIAPKLPVFATMPATPNEKRRWADRVRDSAIASGFNETMLYAFTGERELARFFTDPATAPELANPMSAEARYLVPRALIKYIISAAENMRHCSTVRIFGMAKSFNRLVKSINEREDLIFAYATKGISGESEFYELKGALEALFEQLAITDVWYDNALTLREHTHPAKIFHPYRVALIKIGDETLGIMGEIHPAIVEDFKVRGRIVAAEIDFNRLWKHARDEGEFRPVAKYPAIVRDIAVVVPADTTADAVQDIIENVGEALLTDTDLFDYFQDEEMRLANRKNLAFHMTFQSPDRTLTDAEADKLVSAIMSALEAQGWEVRK